VSGTRHQLLWATGISSTAATHRYYVGCRCGKHVLTCTKALQFFVLTSKTSHQELAWEPSWAKLLCRLFSPPPVPPPKPDLQNYSRIALQGWLFVHFDVRGGPRRSRRGPGGRFRPKVLRKPGQKSPARLPSGTQLRGGLPQGNFFIGTRPASPLSHNNLHKKKTTRATIRPPHGQVAPREKWHDGNHTRQLRKAERVTTLGPSVLKSSPFTRIRWLALSSLFSKMP